MLFLSMSPKTVIQLIRSFYAPIATQKHVTKREVTITVQASTTPIQWEPHTQNNCSLCLIFKKRNQGGRKRKERKGRGRPNEKKALVENKLTQITINPEIIPEKLVSQVPPTDCFFSTQRRSTLSNMSRGNFHI